MSSVIKGVRIVTASAKDRSFVGEVFWRWDKGEGSGWYWHGAWSDEANRTRYTECRSAVAALRREYQNHGAPCTSGSVEDRSRAIARYNAQLNRGIYSKSGVR